MCDGVQHLVTFVVEDRQSMPFAEPKFVEVERMVAVLESAPAEEAERLARAVMPLDISLN